jgi:hypothetical protein
MVNEEIEKKILGLCYEAYFENYLIGIEERKIFEQIKVDKNEVTKALDRLSNEYLIYRDDLKPVILEFEKMRSLLL